MKKFIGMGFALSLAFAASAAADSFDLSDITEAEKNKHCPVTIRMRLIENKNTGGMTLLDCEHGKKREYAAKDGCDISFANIGMNLAIKAIYPFIKGYQRVDERLLNQDICHDFGYMKNHCPAALMGEFDRAFKELKKENILGVEYSHPKTYCHFESS